MLIVNLAEGEYDLQYHLATRRIVHSVIKEQREPKTKFAFFMAWAQGSAISRSAIVLVHHKTDLAPLERRISADWRNLACPRSGGSGVGVCVRNYARQAADNRRNRVGLP
jgi:hypothetical protein